MLEWLAPAIVIAILAGITAVSALRFPKPMRPWVAAAFAEYVACAIAQLVYSRAVVEGGDTLYYSRTGAGLAKFLDNSFSWAAPEMFSLLIQRPSAFDTLLEGAGTNTGSMSAASAFLIFFFGGSQNAAHFFVAGLALFGALAIYRACRAAYSDISSPMLFVATVMFPSIAFWTAALHKEAFCLVGMGLVLAAWRELYGSWARAVLYFVPGLLIILVFRTPVIPPLMLGLAIYVVLERIRRVRGPTAILIAPLYLGLALGVVAVAMLVVTRFAPTFGLDQLGETISTKQGSWAAMRNVGGAAMADGNDAAPQTLGGQLIRLPLALLNALFRPQLFDIHNFGAAAGALEMSAISWTIIVAIRRHGFRGILLRIQRSPFLLMCAVITLIGCSFVGLVTRNFGTLARYRVPFLPFYGALVMALAYRPQTAKLPIPSPIAVNRLRRRRQQRAHVAVPPR